VKTGSGESLFLKKMGGKAMMQVLEFFIENRDLDYSKQDVIEFTGLSRTQIYKIWDSLLEDERIVASRMVGKKTQLYRLNSDNDVVQHLIGIYDKLISQILLQPEVVANPVMVMVRYISKTAQNLYCMSNNDAAISRDMHTCKASGCMAA
jgi:hypothetical protein